MTDDGPASMEEFLSSLPPEGASRTGGGRGRGRPGPGRRPVGGFPRAEAIERSCGNCRRPALSAVGPDMAKVVQAFTPLFHAIVAVAKGHPDTSLREKIEADLASMEEHGWQLTDPGTANLGRPARRREADRGHRSEQRRPGAGGILELLDQPTPEELLATMPDAVREAFQQKGDAAGEALQAALQAMPRTRGYRHCAEAAAGRADRRLTGPPMPRQATHRESRDRSV